MSVTKNTDLAQMRSEYDGGLSEEDLAGQWHTQFQNWFAEAVAFGLPEPNAMILATATPDGHPSARTVLLKGFDERGFTFYTNLRSRKGIEIQDNPQVSLVFPWFAMHRQVLVCGTATVVDREETEAYFAQRPRGAQLGAWASAQSSVLSGRSELELSYAEAEVHFEQDVPPPPHWGGLRVKPDTVEFWQGRRSRLHDRLRYRSTIDQGRVWIVERLAP